MATYRIVCVRTTHPHRHIDSVGVGTSPGVPTRTMITATVRSMIDSGDSFYTESPSTGKRASVLKDTCKEPGCTVQTIRSHSDAVKDNNLDNLSVCP